MIKDQNIICFAPEPWDTIWRNRHHIMTRLARHNRVLYIEPIPYFKPTTRRLIRGGIRPSEIFRASCRRIQDGLFVYRPHPLLPICGKPPLRGVTGALRRRLLKGALERLGVREPVLWFYRPEMHNLIGQFGERLRVYHVVDEYTAYQGVAPSLRCLLRQEELRMLRKVDLVIVVSEALYRAKSPLNANTFIVPNGVDYDAFKASEGTKRSPDDLSGISGPILGYIGLISARLDLGCLRLLIESIPGCSLVLLGSIDEAGAKTEIHSLLSNPRVHYLGPRQPSEIPAYVSRFDVCLIPYQIAEETRNADPLKAYEYLASGKPVVASNIPGLHRFSEVFRLASTRSEFIQGVQDSLLGEDPAISAMRKRLAKENSWEDRVERISHLIEAGLLRPAK